MKENSNNVAIIGIGGGGQNIINYFASRNENDFRLICLNSDEQILNRANAEQWLMNEKKAVFGKESLIIKLFNKFLKFISLYKNSLGCGGKVSTGEKIIQKHLKGVRKNLQDIDNIVIISTFGGGFGTGVTPAVLKLAKDMNIKTSVFVTTPFDFEGKIRMDNAINGVEQIKNCSDKICIFKNQNLLDNMPDKIAVKDALDNISQKIYEAVVIEHKS